MIIPEDDSNPVLFTSSEHHDDDLLSETSIVKKRPKIKRGVSIKSLHLKPESSPWKCHYCGRVFKRMNGLEDHINVIHLKKAKYICKICNKVFKRKPTFHDHLNTHSKMTPYKCDISGKAYGSQGAYKRHVRTSECTMKGQFKCDRCEFKCNRADYLKEHVKGVHDGQKYSCNKCGNSFNWRVTLSRHKKTCTAANFQNYS